MRLSAAFALVLAVVGCAAAPLARKSDPSPRPAIAPAENAPPAAAPKEAVREDAPPPTPPPEPKGPELPLGGRTLFPRFRLVGYCGTPGAPALGKLRDKLPQRAKEIDALAKKYAGGREALPVFELIAVIVQGEPGADKKSRRRVPDAVVDAYLREARAAKALLLLNVQPGHSTFLEELRHYERYLREPDVGVALDPEWSMKPKQKPGVYYGQTTGAVITEVARYMAGIVKEGDLPEKALVFHQMNGYVVKDEAQIEAQPGVVVVKSVDGLGPKGSKIVTYNFLAKNLAPHVHAGFKLFFDEDTQGGRKLMTPDEVLALSPEPEYVLYE